MELILNEHYDNLLWLEDTSSQLDAELQQYRTLRSEAALGAEHEMGHGGW